MAQTADSASGRAPSEAKAFAAAAILAIAIVAIVLGWLGWPFPSYSAARWFAAPLVLIAHAGRRRRDAANLAAILAALASAYIVAVQFLRIGPTAAGGIYVAGVLVITGLSAVQIFRSLRSLRLFDPLLLIAVQLAIALCAHWLYDLVSGNGLNPARYRPDTWITPFAADLPDLAIALAAIGFLIYRSPGSSLSRLGIAKPTSWSITAGLLVAVITLGIAGLASWLTQMLMPGSFAAINAVGDKTVGQPVLGIQLAYAVLAGICEETL